MFVEEFDDSVVDGHWGYSQIGPSVDEETKKIGAIHSIAIPVIGVIHGSLSTTYEYDLDDDGTSTISITPSVDDQGDAGLVLGLDFNF